MHMIVSWMKDLCVPSSGLCREPIGDLDNLRSTDILPNFFIPRYVTFAKCLEILRLWVRHVDYLDFLKPVVPRYISHQHSQLTSKATEETVLGGDVGDSGTTNGQIDNLTEHCKYVPKSRITLSCDQCLQDLRAEFPELQLWRTSEPDHTISVIEIIDKMGRGGDLGDLLKAKGAISCCSAQPTRSSRLEGFTLHFGLWHFMKSFQNSVVSQVSMCVCVCLCVNA
jgi:hypothetical protein